MSKQISASLGGTFRDIRTSRKVTMPTANPRLQVTLTPRSRAALARVAAVQGRPAARVISEIIDEATPILEQLASTMEALSDAASSIKGSVSRRLSTAERRAYSAAVEGMALLADIETDARDLGAVAGRTRRQPRPAASAEPGPDPRPSNTGVSTPLLSTRPRRNRRRQGQLL